MSGTAPVDCSLHRGLTESSEKYNLVYNILYLSKSQSHDIASSVKSHTVIHELTDQINPSIDEDSLSANNSCQGRMLWLGFHGPLNHCPYDRPPAQVASSLYFKSSNLLSRFSAILLLIPWPFVISQYQKFLDFIFFIQYWSGREDRRCRFLMSDCFCSDWKAGFCM